MCVQVEREEGVFPLLEYGWTDTEEKAYQPSVIPARIMIIQETQGH